MAAASGLTPTALEAGAADALAIPSAALARAGARRREGATLADALAELGLADAAAFTQALATAAALPFAATPPGTPSRELLDAIPLPWARRHLVLPLARDADVVTVAIADPTALAPLDDLRFVYGSRVAPLVVPPAVLREAIPRAWDATARSAAATMDAIVEERLQLDELVEAPDDALELLDAGDDAPVIRLVNALLFQAVRDGASDVHVEPYERTLTVRFRIDGLLHEVVSPPARFHPVIASRLKIMARLDIAERRLPQDGRIQLRAAGRDIDVRASFVPTAWGERVVLRLLDRDAAPLDLAALGTTPAVAAALDGLLARTHGIVLVTGPTGSGKTTTLYALLRRLAIGERNVLTIEDPVEHQLAGVGQMPVNPRIGLTFASGLRAILRQGPDVILVGEIRDRETVEIALRAALTGHLVFSTLHTNDAAGAMTRLLDMEVEPFLISSSVLAIVAQRLVRLVCPACVRHEPPTAAERRALGEPAPDVVPHAGPGCDACRGTGHRRRTAIHELLVVDDGVRALVMERRDATAIRRHARVAGAASLRDDGLARVRAGLTTVAEVLRVTEDEA